MLTKEEIKEKCDNIFFWYEETRFDPEECKPYDVELVESFLDYLNDIGEVDMAYGLKLIDTMPDENAYRLASKIQKKMIRGCEKWLGYDEDPVQGLIKATKELKYGKVLS